MQLNATTTFRLPLRCVTLLLILTLQIGIARAEADTPVSANASSAQPSAAQPASPVAEIREPSHKFEDEFDKKLDVVQRQRQAEPQGYVANGDGVQNFFNALSIRLKKPVILSKKAAQCKVTGDFDLSQPQQALEQMALRLGLIWYHDGQSVYVYDASEARNTVVSLKKITVAKLKASLRQSGLYDRRYPLRGAESGNVFYLSGPPVYVDLVANTARFMDNAESSLGNLKISVVHLQNTFVGDRSFTLRDKVSVVPGIASVIEQILKDEKIAVEMTVASPTDSNGQALPPLPPLSSLAGKADLPPQFPVKSGVLEPQPPSPSAWLKSAAKNVMAAAPSGIESPIRVLAYPDTNSLLVKGTPEQVAFIENLIATLDVAKRHIELSLWIIDIQADQLDQLGVTWKGGVRLKGFGGVSFNASISTLDGMSFLASIQALNSNQKARIVSRPVVLTEENTPAFFDHNRTFYVKLRGERAVQLEHVTYGTLIQVLPRFATNGQIEMSLEIEDGNEVSNGNGEEGDAAILPKVARTRISTVARVPKGKSLLIGGYTRDEGTDRVEKIPVLGDLPLIGGAFRTTTKHESNMVRVFLIEPKYNDEARQRDASDLVDDVMDDRTQDAGLKSVRDYVNRENGN